MQLLGEPQRGNNKFLHVAGTNGKGSVCTKLARVLELGGFRTGLYTSPHLFSFTERIAIDGATISQEQFAETFEFVEGVRVKHEVRLTFF